MSLFSRPRRRAFSLIEVVLALGVVSAAVLALIGILGSTFSSAREVAMQHRAVNAITQLDGALQTASGIQGLPTSTDPAFNRILNLLISKSAANGTQFVDLFVYQKTQDKTAGVPVVFYPPSGQFTLADSKTVDHDGIDTSTVFRMRIRVSQLLKGKLYKLNTSTYEPDPAQWSGAGDIATSPDDYALAYLPLTVEVYTHDFSEGTNPGTTTPPKVFPILTQTVVINR